MKRNVKEFQASYSDMYDVLTIIDKPNHTAHSFTLPVLLDNLLGIEVKQKRYVEYETEC
jgi:hypothetical protein